MVYSPKRSIGFQFEDIMSKPLPSNIWAIGDLSRKKDFDVNIKDTPINKPVKAAVTSKDFPQSDLDFTKAGDNLYVTQYFAEEKGFNELLGAVFAVNYNDEYLNIGFNDELKDTVMFTGGKIFRPDDVDKIIESVRTFSKRTSTETVNLRWPFVLAALLIFVLDIAIRRIKEYRAK